MKNFVNFLLNFIIVLLILWIIFKNITKLDTKKYIIIIGSSLLISLAIYYFDLKHTDKVEQIEEFVDHDEDEEGDIDSINNDNNDNTENTDNNEMINTNLEEGPLPFDGEEEYAESLNNAEEIYHSVNNNISNSGNTDYNTNTDLEGGIHQQKYKNILDKDTLTTLNLSGKSVAGKNIEIKNTNYKDFSLNYNFNQRGDSITNNYNPNEDTGEEN